MSNVIAGVSAFVLGLGLTLAAERIALRLGVVARPAADRWHRQPVPLLGGVAIMLATLGPILVITGGAQRFATLAAMAGAMGLVGLIDDVRRLSPQTKVLAQLVLSGILLFFGFVLGLTDYPLLNVFITLCWLVGITNAFNLLDNMDGLAAAIALVAGAFRLLFFTWQGDAAGAAATSVFLGAMAAFLIRNFPPARIFMGDAGSLFIGFFIGGLSISAPEAAYSRGVLAVLAIPVALLLIPIFDTAFVTVTRLLGGRSPAVGGRDHTSHRLVATGVGERAVVLLLTALSAAGGGVAALSYLTGMTYSVALLALLVIGLVLFAVHLSQVRILEVEGGERSGTVLRLLADFQYKRQVLTLLLDAALIPLAYYAAYLIRFEDHVAAQLTHFYRSLPVVMLAQLASLGGLGLYRGVWRYMGLSDVIHVVKATTAGTVLAVAALTYLNRFQELSRSAFVLDWILLTMLVLASRASFRLFAELLRPQPPSFVRVLIYGAGHGGELIAREILNNPGHQRVPVGFIDDDRAKHQTRIHGCPVLGDVDQLDALLRERGVMEVIVSSELIGPRALARAREICQQHQVALRRLSLRIE